MVDTSDHPQDGQTKRRVSKACDNCRVLKSRCERETPNQDCRRCELEGLECTSDAPVKRRGPAKGYVQLVETRVHELEAVMGVLLSNPHPEVRNMFVTLTQDAFANDVLTQVANGAFGPRALARFATEHDAGRASTSSDGQTPPQGGPTNGWQLQAVRTMIARSQIPSANSLIPASALTNEFVQSNYPKPCIRSGDFRIRLTIKQRLYRISRGV